MAEKEKEAFTEKLHTRLGKPDPLFFRHLRWLLTAIAALVMVVAISLFFTFERIIRSNTYDSALDQLNQTAASTADLVETIQQITFQIQKDKSISPVLNYNSATPGQVAVALDQLANYQCIIKSLSSIYVYNARSDIWYTSTGITGTDNKVVSGERFPDVSARQMIDEYLDYQTYSTVPRNFNGQSFYTFFGYDFTHINTEGELNCAVLVNVSSDWLSDAVASGFEGIGETIVLDSKGFTVSETDNFPMQQDFTELYPGAASIIGAGASGFLVTGSGSARTFVAYTAPDKMGWQYVRLIPYDSLTDGIWQMLSTTILIIAAFLLAGLAVSWYLNRLLYRPIDRFKADISRMETTERENFFPLKNAFLRGLILSPGSIAADTAELKQKLMEFDCQLDPNKPVLVAYIRPNRLKELDALTDSEAAALRFSILNIACEIVGQQLNSSLPEGADLQQGRLVLLFNVSPEKVREKDFSAKLYAVYSEVQNQLQKALNLSVSIGISDAADFRSLFDLYQMAQDNCFQALFAKDRSIVIGSQSDRMSDYRYPEKKEKALIDALLHGRFERAKALYLEIIDECADAPLYIFNTTVLRLSSMCNQVAANLMQLKDMQPFFINLSLFESVDEINAEFFRIFETITAVAETQAASKSGQIAAEVDRIINERFSDPTLSIEAIADALGLSSSYLGRIYKSGKGRTILDAILEARMREARRLLKESNLSIAEISERCGFSSDSYFYKIFRQENGTTPAAYRRG